MIDVVIKFFYIQYRLTYDLFCFKMIAAECIMLTTCFQFRLEMIAEFILLTNISK